MKKSIFVLAAFVMTLIIIGCSGKNRSVRPDPYVPPVSTVSFIGAYTIDGVNYALLSVPNGYTGGFSLNGSAVSASDVRTNANGSKLVKIAVPYANGTITAPDGFSKPVTFGAVSAKKPETVYGTAPMTFSAFFHDITGDNVPDAPVSTSFAENGTVTTPAEFITQGTRTGGSGTPTYAAGDSLPKVDAVSSATYGDSVHFIPTGNLLNDGSGVTEKTDPNAAITGIKKAEAGIDFDLYANAKLLQAANRATAQSANVIAAVSDFEKTSAYYADGSIMDADGSPAADLGVYKVKYLLTDGNWGPRVAPTAGTAATPAALPANGTNGGTAAVSYGGNWADKQVTYTFGGLHEPEYAGNNYWDNFFEFVYGGYVTDENGHTEPLVFLQNLFSHRAHVNFDVAVSPYRFARMKELAKSGTFTVTVLVYGFEDIVFTVDFADYTNGNAAADNTAIGIERGTADPTNITITGIEQYNAGQAALKRGQDSVDAGKYSLSYDAGAQTVILTLNPAFSGSAGFGGSYTLSFLNNTDTLKSKTIALTVTDLSFRPGLSADGNGSGVPAKQNARLNVDADGRIYIHDNVYALALTLSTPRGAYSTLTAEDDGMFSAVNRNYDADKGLYYIDLSAIQIDGEHLHHAEDFTLTLVAPVNNGGTLIYFIHTNAE